MDQNGTDTAQIYAEVLVLFTPKALQSLLFLLIFCGVVHVRDVGVAGSNPATPTNT